MVISVTVGITIVIALAYSMVLMRAPPLQVCARPYQRAWMQRRQRHLWRPRQDDGCQLQSVGLPCACSLHVLDCRDLVLLSPCESILGS